MCFAENLTQWNESCNYNQTIPNNMRIDSDNSTFAKWIILNPFEGKQSNIIIDYIKNNETTNVTGMIFETNQIISTN